MDSEIHYAKQGRRERPSLVLAVSKFVISMRESRQKGNEINDR